MLYPNLMMDGIYYLISIFRNLIANGIFLMGYIYKHILKLCRNIQLDFHIFMNNIRHL